MLGRLYALYRASLARTGLYVEHESGSVDNEDGDSLLADTRYSWQRGDFEQLRNAIYSVNEAALKPDDRARFLNDKIRYLRDTGDRTDLEE